MSFSPDKIKQLKDFIGFCQKNPQVLHAPEFDFFKDYLTSLGAHIPPA